MQIFQIINDSVNRVMFIHFFQENVFLKPHFAIHSHGAEMRSVNKSNCFEE